MQGVDRMTYREDRRSVDRPAAGDTEVTSDAAAGSPDDAMRVLLLVEQLRRRAAGGIGTYIRGLIQGLRDVGDARRVRVELFASRPRTTPDPLVALGPPFTTSRLPGPLLTRGWDTGIIRAPKGHDVVHALSLATPEPRGSVLVSTVHDVLWRHVPDAYPTRGRLWHEAALHRSIRRARRFIVPSETVAGDLVDAGAHPDLIRVVPMGCDHLPPPDDGETDALLHRLGISGPFLLSVGTMEPRKNLVRLVEAYERARPSLPEPWPLVVVGPSGWGEQLRPHPGVVFAGVVNPRELAGLYARSRLLAYVPLREGFGLPPVEAMWAGAPVVASDVPSTDGSAYQVDPGDTDAIAEGLIRVGTDEVTRIRLVEAGRARAAELAWTTIARRHVEVWEDAHASR